jgi:hypothetical protein
MAEKKPRVRVRQPGQHALYDADAGVHVIPRIDEYFDVDHPLVKAHPWAFGTDAELAEQVDQDRRATSVAIPDVEAATAAPGEKRTTRRQS